MENTDLATQIAHALEERLNPKSYFCLRRSCSNISHTPIAGGMCSLCQQTWTFDEVQLSNIATRMGFGPGVFFSDLETMLGRSLEDLEALDADQLAALWDSAGLSKGARPLSPSEKRQIKESNDLRLYKSRRRQQERHLAAAEKALAVATEKFEAAQEAARWLPEEIEVATTKKAVRR